MRQSLSDEYTNNEDLDDLHEAADNHHQQNLSGMRSGQGRQGQGQVQ